MDETKSLQLIKMYKDVYKESDADFITITELMNLTNVGIPSMDLTFSKTKMSSEHSICVRQTCVKHKHFNPPPKQPNNQCNGSAKFFLNEDDLSSSFDSKKDYQFNSNSYDKYSNGRNSISSDRSDESCTKSNQKSKKNSFNSKFKLTGDKTNYFLGNNLSVYKSENNLDNCSYSTLSRNGRKMMIKSNSFNNVTNNRTGIYRSNTENYYSVNSNHFTNNHLDVPRNFSRLIPQYSSILYLINPYDARITKFETDYVKIAQLNPIRTFLAVATNYTVHILSIKSTTVISTRHMSENIEHITWISPIILAIITSRTIYHWNLKNDTNHPVIVFFKSPKMYNCQIVNYESDDKMAWFALSSLSLEEDNKTITGLVQIHHINEQTKMNGYSDNNELDANNNCCFQQCIEAHSVSFASVKFNENNLESTTLIAIKKTSYNTIKIFITELGPLNPKNNLLVSRTEMLMFNDTVNGYQIDLPLYNVVCLKLGVIYIISKYGRLIMCDLQTGVQLNEQKMISEDIIISARLDIADNQSLICINRSGQILQVEFDFYSLVKRLSNDNKLKKIGKRIAFALTDINDEITRL